MPAIYQALGTHELLVYIVLAIGAMFGLRWLWRSWREWREAVYGLEKEFALRRMSQAIAGLSLILVLFCGELVTASFILPNLPASLLVPSATPDFLATPTGTISPELATEIALTPRPTHMSSSSSGCVSCKAGVSWASTCPPGASGASGGRSACWRTRRHCLVIWIGMEDS